MLHVLIKVSNKTNTPTGKVCHVYIHSRFEKLCRAVGTLHVRLKLPLAQFQYFFNHFNATNSMCDSARSGCTRVTTQLHKNSQLRNRTLNARTLTHELNQY
jgi:hypothetical protein